MYGIVNYIWLFLRENVLVYIYIPYMDGLGMESGLGLRFRVEVLGFQKTLRLVKNWERANRDEQMSKRLHVSSY